MKATIRRHRGSDKPIGFHRTIASHEIDERYIEVLRRLEPYYHFKFATIPWLHYLTNSNVEYSVFRKYLSYLRQAPNHYLSCPEHQNASPNVDRKTLVFELAERGLNELIRRGIVAKRHSPDPEAKPPKSNRNFAFALHRSNSYYHELIVDVGYFAPLQYLVRNDPSLRLLDFSQLIVHRNVPQKTREAKDPLLIELKYEQLRFDGTPLQLLCTQCVNCEELPLTRTHGDHSGTVSSFDRPNGLFPLGGPQTLAEAHHQKLSVEKSSDIAGSQNAGGLSDTSLLKAERLGRLNSTTGW